MTSFADKPVLSGVLVDLRPFTADDVEAMAEILVDHDPAGRDQGFGTEATRLVLTHAFDALGLNRVALEVFAFNPRARRVDERAGFVHEGTRREALRFDDDLIDALDFAILDREWSAQRAAGAAVHDRGSTPTTTDR